MSLQVQVLDRRTSWPVYPTPASRPQSMPFALNQQCNSIPTKLSHETVKRHVTLGSFADAHVTLERISIKSGQVPFGGE